MSHAARVAHQPTARVPFKIFRAFNTDEYRGFARSTFRLDAKSAPVLTGDPLAERIVHELAARRAINVKETLESFETFARIRRRLRAPRVADLCCGHGLTGLLFAAIERSVEEVVLLDRDKPPKAELVREAVIAAAPWTADKVRWVEAPIEEASAHLAPDTNVVAVHACGVRTDRALDVALALHSSVAVVPCCYAQTAKRAPRALKKALGSELATDIHRTYRLEAAGYRVDWQAIPEAITPKNRVMVGVPS